jgi:hypothetical protein
LLPFFDLEKLSPDNLLTISNYLKNEAANAQHSILHLYAQYETTYSQLDKINRLRLEKMTLSDTMEVDIKTEPVDGTIEASTSNN